MKLLLISIFIISLSYVLSDVTPASNDNQRISSNIKHRNNRNNNNFSGKRIRIKSRKYQRSSLNRKHNNKSIITTTIIPNIVNNTNIDYNLPLPGTIKLPVVAIQQNLLNHKPIDYGNDWTHWEIPNGQYFTVLQTLMIQRENIDLQIQHTFGLLNAERKLRDEPLLDYSDYSPCNKNHFNNDDNNNNNNNNKQQQEKKKEIIRENNKKINDNEMMMMNQFKNAQIIFNETDSGRLHCQCKVLKENNKND